jgi:SPP1 family predicted phage head-tail adaptor
MDINRLRHQIIIEENTGTINDGAGNKIPAWQTMATVWAEVRPTSAYEAVIADRRGEYVTHMIKIRYLANLKKDKHRVNYNGRIFLIQYILNPDEKNIELNLQCKEGVNP